MKTDAQKDSEFVRTISLSLAQFRLSGLSNVRDPKVREERLLAAEKALIIGSHRPPKH